MDFSETIQWVNVVKPFNTDYNVAEKTVLVFLEAHGFIVGDYLTENSSGATGIVYEVPDTNTLYLARQDLTDFPYMGTVTVGTTASTYIESYTEHGINNEVIQNLVDRTAYNKKEIEDNQESIVNLGDRTAYNKKEIEDNQESIVNLGDQITNIAGDIPDLSYVTTTESMTLSKNRVTSANINSPGDIILSLPSDVVNGDWVTILHGGVDPMRARLIMEFTYHGYHYHSPPYQLEIDQVYQFITFVFNRGAWHVIY